ncbi:MAG: bifunctional pyr operon transcriptional regulator/uracil phosphoribosyltransferase [Deltaproteobacteria bacterium]|nr:MAG: bifunctional pyr operon transcriptional regulator/uracil phosphoribosyltransferase [Deltaproteobacteria bacterium]
MSREIMNRPEIDLALKKIARQILEQKSSADRLALVGIHTCGVYLAERIQRMIKEQTGAEIDFGSLDITLYRDDWSLISRNPVVKTTDIPFAVGGSRIILVDDVIFTGRTIRAALDALMDYGRPLAVQLAVLIDRNGREIPIQPDYTGQRVKVQPHEHIQVRLAEQGSQDLVIIEG